MNFTLDLLGGAVVFPASRASHPSIMAGPDLATQALCFELRDASGTPQKYSDWIILLMPYNFDETLCSPLITVVNRDDQRGEFSIKLGSLHTLVVIKLSFGAHGSVRFACTHAIHTPIQWGPYRTSRPWADDRGYALHLAVHGGLTFYYKAAIKAGFEPKEEWLVAW